MKLSETTLKILKNFNSLNKSILFYPGQEIKNLSSDKSVYMTAVIEEEIPKKFAILNIGELLQVLAVIENADIEFKEDHIFISNKTNSVVFKYALSQVVDDVYQRKITLADPTFEIDLSSEQIKNLFNMSSCLKINDVKVEPGDDGKLVLYDAKGTHSHTYTINTGVKIDIEPITFNISVLSILDIDYKVSYYKQKNLVRFAGVDTPVKYHVSSSNIVTS